MQRYKESMTLLAISLAGSSAGLGLLFGYMHVKQEGSTKIVPPSLNGVTREMALGLVSPVATTDSGRTMADQARIVVFHDYQCGSCNTLHQRVEAHAKKAGTFVFRNLPLESHPNAFYCATVAEAAREQGKFSPMSDFLFKVGGQADDPLVKMFCQTNAIDYDKLKVAMRGSARRRVLQDIKDAKAMKLTYTPTIISVKPGVPPKVIATVEGMVN